MRIPMTTNRMRNSDESAFTLVETIVALLILSIGLLALAQLFIFSTYNNSFAYSASTAIKAAEDTVEMLRGLPFTDAKLAIGGTIRPTPAPCTTGCLPDKDHVRGVYFRAA